MQAAEVCSLVSTYFNRLTFNLLYDVRNVSSCMKKKSQSSSSSSSSFKSSRESNVLPASGRSRVRDAIDYDDADADDGGDDGDDDDDDSDDDGGGGGGGGGDDDDGYSLWMLWLIILICPFIKCHNHEHQGCSNNYYVTKDLNRMTFSLAYL